MVSDADAELRDYRGKLENVGRGIVQVVGRGIEALNTATTPPRSRTGRRLGVGLEFWNEIS